MSGCNPRLWGKEEGLDREDTKFLALLTAVKSIK